jgi:hypothetical protein
MSRSECPRIVGHDAGRHSTEFRCETDHGDPPVRRTVVLACACPRVRLLVDPVDLQGHPAVSQPGDVGLRDLDDEIDATDPVGGHEGVRRGFDANEKSAEDATSATVHQSPSTFGVTEWLTCHGIGLSTGPLPHRTWAHEFGSHDPNS